MSAGAKRLAKRSILGTRVSCVRRLLECEQQDGRLFANGIIQAVKNDTEAGRTYYSVRFDSDGVTQEYRHNEIIGPGFMSHSSVKLQPGQTVFLTYQGREVPGTVLNHLVDVDQVNIELANSTGKVRRRMEDVRLVESRKSARLACGGGHSHDMDSSPPGSDAKRSSAVDMPANPRKRCRSPNVMVIADQAGEHGGDLMDEVTAAMVLTSLSCSPAQQDPSKFSPAPATAKSWSDHYSSSVPYSTGGSESSNSPSPPHPLHVTGSCAQPVGAGDPSVITGSSAPDEGIDLDEMIGYLVNDVIPKKRKSTSNRSPLYQCTWPGCGKVMASEGNIECHVRRAHLGPKEPGNSDEGSDHEEEFYYQEIDVLGCTNNGAAASTATTSHVLNDQESGRGGDDLAVCSPSPATQELAPDSVHAARAAPHVDHEYVRRPGDFSLSPSPSSSPLGLGVQRSLSWQPNSHTITVAAASVVQVSTGDGHQQLAASPKFTFLSSSPKMAALKKRGESRKCRKVYGMDNRELWCTQCRWKKACTRFTE